MLITDTERLRAAAFDHAEHGWPIAPGIRPAPRRPDGWPVPDPAAMPYLGSMNTNAVAAYWQNQPHALLVGAGFPNLDIFQLHQRTAAAALRHFDTTSTYGPVAVLPNGQRLFFVETGDPPPQDLLGRGVRRHGTGWIPLPPTRIGRQAVTWHTEPAGVGWRLFPRDLFFDALRATRPQ